MAASPSISSQNVTVLGEKPADRTRAFLPLFLPPSGALLGGLFLLALTNALLLAIPRLVNEGIAAVEGTQARGPSVLAPIGIEHATLAMIVGAIVFSAAVGAVARVM